MEICPMTDQFDNNLKIIIKTTLLLFFLIFFSSCNVKEYNAKETTPKIQIQYNTSEITDCDYTFKLSKGRLYAKGQDFHNLLGEEEGAYYDDWICVVTESNIVHYEAVSGTIVYLTSDGCVYGFGNTEGGVLQTTENTYYTSPVLLFDNCKYVSLGIRFTLFIKNDDTLWFSGESKNGQGMTVKESILKPIKMINEKVQFVRAFGYSSAWIDKDLNLYLCGDNSYGQIGNGKIGCGFPTLFQDIVVSPHLALQNCVAFKADCIHKEVSAVTVYGERYSWGGDFGSLPTLQSE